MTPRQVHTPASGRGPRRRPERNACFDSHPHPHPRTGLAGPGDLRELVPCGQTLTCGAEANLVKLAKLRGTLTADEVARWAEVRAAYVRTQATSRGSTCLPSPRSPQRSTERPIRATFSSTRTGGSWRDSASQDFPRRHLPPGRRSHPAEGASPALMTGRPQPRPATGSRDRWLHHGQAGLRRPRTVQRPARCAGPGRVRSTASDGRRSPGHRPRRPVGPPADGD